MEKISFGAGCFWGVEHAFKQVEGVIETRVGYQGGQTSNPTYKEVCHTETGHAEVVEVTFDSQIISLKRLLDAFSSSTTPPSSIAAPRYRNSIPQLYLSYHRGTKKRSSGLSRRPQEEQPLWDARCDHH